MVKSKDVRGIPINDYNNWKTSIEIAFLLSNQAHHSAIFYWMKMYTLIDSYSAGKSKAEERLEE